jgi:3D (Asp-Asp-Asp) domain-containing protein
MATKILGSLALAAVVLVFTAFCAATARKADTRFNSGIEGSPAYSYAAKTAGDDNSFPVAIVCDGDIIRVRASMGDSVEETLALGGVVAGPKDIINHPLYGPVDPGDKIVVERYIKADFNEDEEIPFETITVTTSLVKPGVTLVVSEGSKGIYRRVYEREMIGSKITEEILKSEGEYKAPVNRKVLVGEAGAPVSDLDFEWETDANGLPATYEALITGGRSAGYYAAPGAMTASGRPAAVGYVAVNPGVIPYGSKLYITSGDGSFVYGYAIAADTGSSLMQGVIDIDLFYASYLESCLNEIRSVDIYILEYPE